jgi:hypothetical protein
MGSTVSAVVAIAAELGRQIARLSGAVRGV